MATIAAQTQAIITAINGRSESMEVFYLLKSAEGVYSISETKTGDEIIKDFKGWGPGAIADEEWVARNIALTEEG
jgi:hypothetical protein